jgi:ABC-2 type transport system ATP-binding protein
VGGYRVIGNNPAGEPTIQVEGLKKRYGDIQALNGVSFQVGKAELFGLLGPNGAGKTTTLKVLTLLARPDEGDVQVAGLSIRKDQEAIKTRIGVVPQEINLDKELGVGENLEIFGLLHGVPDLPQKVARSLRAIGLWERRTQRVQELSGGLQRRLLIARALMPEPEILFLDEPTVGLDPQIRREIWDEIRRIRRRGCTVLLTTHYIEEAELLCDRVGILNNGELVALDTPDVLKRRVGQFVLEVSRPDGTISRHSCPDEEACREKAAAATGDALTIRRSNLEDVFVALTGERIRP